jgi:hypothetical protein
MQEGVDQVVCLVRAVPCLVLGDSGLCKNEMKVTLVTSASQQGIWARGGVAPGMLNLLKPSGNFTYHQV